MNIGSRVMYDPVTGKFDPPGNIVTDGYRQFKFDGVYYQASHIAWYLTTGKWPSNEIDHKNRIRDDDRFENLREATHSQNQANKPSAHRRHVSPYRGVYKQTGGGWTAKIRVNGKRLHLGTFRDPRDAATAYRKAALQHFGEFACLET